MKFEIRDWTNKLCFYGITFNTFESAWDHIYAHDPEPPKDSVYWLDDWYSDYVVTEIEG